MFKYIYTYMLNIYKLKKNNLKKDIVIKKEGISVENMKYQPAYSREWGNSIYTFNKNTVKSLPSTDVYVSKLIKSHFNLFNKNFEMKARVYTTKLNNRVSKLNKIFIGKPEFKHTNDKVIITLFIYNQELLSYIKKMKKIRNLKLNKNKINNIKNLHTIKNIYTIFLKKANNISSKYLNKINYNILNIENFTLLDFIKKTLVNIKLYIHLKRIIHLNLSKFNSIHIAFLRNLLRKIYAKDVEFNIVNLKHYKLNSSILTQILAMKLKNRKNKPSLLMNTIIKKFNLPYNKLINIPYKISNYSTNQNLIIRSIINNNFIKKVPNIELPNYDKNISKYSLNKLYIKKLRNDKLNNYLNNIYPKQYIIKLTNSKEIFIKSRNLENTVLDNIKNKIINGIRLESKGRLTRRISGRAIHYMKQKGTTRNVYSSYKGVSSILLRGYLNNNIDLAKSNNKGSLGSFGLKGWISSI